MQILLMNKGKGKTSIILNRMHNDPHSVMICHTQEEARRVWEESYSWGINVLEYQFIPAFKARNELQGRTVSNLYVDNIELVLSVLLGNPVDVVTADNDFTRVIRK